MSVSTISVKGQITLPVKLRKKLGMKPHDRVSIESTEDAIIIKRVTDFFALEGFLGKALPEKKARAQMLAAVSRRVQGKPK